MTWLLAPAPALGVGKAQGLRNLVHSDEVVVRLDNRVHDSPVTISVTNGLPCLGRYARIDILTAVAEGHSECLVLRLVPH